MRVTVIQNPTAGEARVSGAELCAVLRAAGHEPVYASTLDDGWERAVQEADNAVLAVGGDGTIARVARRLAGGPVPLAMLPFGTANNIPMTFGMRGDWRTLVGGLDGWEEIAIDMGSADVATDVASAAAPHPFLESVGFGLFADLVAGAQRDDAELASRLGRSMELLSDVARVHDALAQAPLRRCRIEVDGHGIVADALLVAIMNIPWLGPRLLLSPGARPDDGLLHVVVAREAQRAQLAAYLDARLEGEAPPLSLEEHTGRRVTVAWSGPCLHVDDRPLAGGPRGLHVTATVAPGALRVLVPPGA
jgi:diacylglycerol kinase (ATP)